MNFLAELSPQAKAILGGLVVVLLLAVGANFIPRGGGSSAGGGEGGGAPSGQVVIYSNMEPKIAAEAAAVLKEKQIPFQLVKEGTAISVPQDKADEARIKLAVAGHPKEGDVGFSQLFGDKPNSFISTDFEKKTAYNRAIMGELSRIIRKIEGVENASVLLNIPEEQLFAEEKKPTTASVMVKLVPGRMLAKQQVEGIVHLVASSVPGLRTNNVTVVADNGKLLTEGMSDNAGDVEDRLATKALHQQMEMTRARETSVETKVQSLLDKVYGPGRAVVRVAMELDFTQEKRRQRLYAPPNDIKGGNAPTYSERTTERSTGSSNGGVPGTTTNIPNYPMENQGSANGTSTERTTERVQNNSYSMSESLTEGEIGTIKRMSVTVLVQGLQPDGVNNLTQIVTSASGADVARRGDSVVVRPVNFDDSQLRALKDLMEMEEKAKEAANPKNKKKEGGIPLSWIIGTGAAFVILFLLLAIMRMANRKEDTTDVLVNTLGDPGLPPQFDPNALAGYNNGYEMTGSVPAMGGVGEGPFSFLEQMDPEMVAELMAQERPGTAAGILALIDPGYADTVLSMLPPEMADDLVNRIQTQAELPAFQQKTISQQLKRRLGVPA